MTTLRAAPECALRVVRLGDEHLGALRALVAADPYVNAVLAARLGATATLTAPRLGGAVLGILDADTPLVRAAVFNGGNLLPIGGDAASWSALAQALAARRRICTSIVGTADAVLAMWRVLEPAWDAARAIRINQPLLVCERQAAGVDGDSRVRVVRPDELENYLPAAAAMFSEELGVSPLSSSGSAAYRRRVAALIDAGQAFAIIDRHGRVAFKADLAVVSEHTCQVQGVWVRPELRGRGIGTAALATVIAHALTLAPTVSLYVNDYNVAARRMYARLGMQQVCTLATILF